MDAFLGRFPPSSVTDLLLFWTSHLKVGSSPFWNTNSVATVDIKRYVFVTIVYWANISILDFLAALAAMALQLSTLYIVPMVIFDSRESQKCMIIWFEYSFHVMWWNLIHQNLSNTWSTVQIRILTQVQTTYTYMVYCWWICWFCLSGGDYGMLCIFIWYHILRNVCKGITENCEFIFWGLHGTFPILIVASLNFARRGRATTQWDACSDRS
jgi:hypothetical protein